MIKRPKHKTDQKPKIGNLGEQLLAAGIRVPGASDTSKRIGESKKPQWEDQQPGSSISHEGKPTPKTRKRNNKATRDKTSKNKRKKDQRLRGSEAKMRQREKAGGIVSTPLFGEVHTTSPSNPVEDEYSVNRVHAKLRESSTHLRNETDATKLIAGFNGEKDVLSDRMSAFQHMLELAATGGETDCELVIGFDLGSTSSKIVLQFPYEKGLGAFAIPAPGNLRAEDHAYYWKTLVWKDSGGNFSLAPIPGAALRNNLKVTFLTARIPPQSSVSSEQINVTAYLVLMIRQALGWIWKRLGQGLTSRQLRISANFGFPAKFGEKSPVFDSFHNCAHTALQIALSNARVCSEEIKKAILRKAESRDKTESSVLVVPEFIGAVMGYFHSAQKHNGQFMICDFGGLTIDSVCFGFFQRDDGESLIAIYGSDVENFGAEVAKNAVENGVPTAKLAAAIGSFLCGPVLESFEKTGHKARAWGGRMPLFVIGGGRHYKGYDGAIPWAENSIKKSIFNTEFTRQELELDEEIDISLAQKRSCGRLMVAWGLSHSDLDLPEWIARGDLPDAPKQKFRNIQDNFISKDQT